MNQLPAHLQNRASKTISNTLAANLGAGSPPFVSIQGNRFNLIDATGAEDPVPTFDPKTGPYLDCCIIDSNDHESKIYYAKAFDPSAKTFQPPDCWSDNGIGPSRNCSVPQSPTCGACPNAVWGSATSKVSGKGVPACGKYQKLALAIPGDDVVFLLRVPPNSLGNLRDYNETCAKNGIDVSDVITRISFEQSGVGTLLFRGINYIDAELAQMREKVLLGKGTDSMVGRTDLPREGAVMIPPQTDTARLAAPTGAGQASSQSQKPLDTSTTATTAAPAGGAATASPTEGGRRRRRTSAQPEAQQQPTQNAPFVPAQPAGNAQFGMSEGSAGNPDLNATLNNLFPQQ